MYVFTILFIHSLINGHFGCFDLLAIVNNAAMNIGEQVSLGDHAFYSFWCLPRGGGIARYIIIVFLIFWGTTILFLHSELWLHHFTFLAPEYKCSSFSISSSTLAVFCFFFITAILEGRKWHFIAVLICNFLMTKGVELFFMCWFGHLCSPEKGLFNSCPFFKNWVVTNFSIILIAFYYVYVIYIFIYIQKEHMCAGRSERGIERETLSLAGLSSILLFLGCLGSTKI